MTLKLRNGITINYEVYGTGQRILMLHGWGNDLRSFDLIRNRLSTHFQLILIDLPGFGLSSAPPYPYSLDDYTKVTQEILNHLEINEIFLIGHSFGGAVGVKLALSSRNVKKLILEDSPVIRIKSPATRIKVFLYKTLRAFLDEKYREKLRNAFGSTDYRQAGTLRDTLVKVTNEDLRQQLPQIKIPTLLVWGENDQETPLIQARIIKSKISGSSLAVIKDAGHFPHIDKPEEYNSIIQDFLFRDS